MAVEGEGRVPASGLGTLRSAGLRCAQGCPVSVLCSFAFVDLGSAQKVALVIQELNGKPFHNKKLYVNSSRSSSKRTPGVAARPQELQVRAPGSTLLALRSLFRGLHTSFGLSYSGEGRGLDEIRKTL